MESCFCKGNSSTQYTELSILDILTSCASILITSHGTYQKKIAISILHSPHAMDETKVTSTMKARKDQKARLICPSAEGISSVA